MGWLVFILGLLLLIAGLPLIWKLAKGLARIILSVLIFSGAVYLIYVAIVQFAIFTGLIF